MKKSKLDFKCFYYPWNIFCNDRKQFSITIENRLIEFLSMKNTGSAQFHEQFVLYFQLKLKYTITVYYIQHILKLFLYWCPIYKDFKSRFKSFFESFLILISTHHNYARLLRLLLEEAIEVSGLHESSSSEFSLSDELSDSSSSSELGSSSSASCSFVGCSHLFMVCLRKSSLRNFFVFRCS